MQDISQKIHFKIFSIIFLLLPFSLITGPFIPDLFLTLIGTYFLFISIAYKFYHYYRNKFIYIFFTFYIYLLLRGFFSDYPFMSLIEFNGPIFYFRYIFFVLGINFLLDYSPELVKKFSLCLFSVVIFCVVDGYFQWIFGYNLFGFQSPSIRVTGVFGKEEVLGHFLSHIVPLLIALLAYLYKTKKKTSIAIIFILMISEILIFITNDRAGFLKISQFTILLILLSSNFKFLRLISFIISVVIIYLLILSAPDSKERFRQTVTDVSSTSIPYMPWSPGHEKHFSVAIDMFKENPIFGQGPQLFKTLCQITPEKYLDKCTSHPHNYYFQTLGELGLLGTIFLVFGFIYTTSILLKNFYLTWFSKSKTKKLPDYYLFLLILVFLILWPLIPNQSFYNNWLNVTIYLPVGFLLYFRKKINDFD